MNGSVRVTSSREGAITAGVWLISLGTVFLVRNATEWSWGEAWPLFLTAGGIASLTSSVIGRRHLGVGAWSLVWPLAWIGVGIVLLLSTTGRLDTAPAELIWRWWPAAVVAAGAWCLVAAVWQPRRNVVESLSMPLAGAGSGAVRIRFGGGSLSVAAGDPGALVSGTFEGGVVARTRGRGNVDLEPDGAGPWWTGKAYDWRVGLTPAVPLDLRVEMGANRATLDLSELRVGHLDLRSGASDTRVRLPAAAGMTTVRSSTAAAALTMEVPEGVAARIRGRMTVGSLIVDPARFPASVDGFTSPDYATAANRVDVFVEGGIGSVRIV